MKKTVLAILLLALAASGYAQSIVPRAGFTLSTVRTDVDDEPDLKSMPGFTLGAGFEIPINERFSVQPELNFIQKGYRAKDHYSLIFAESLIEEESDAKITLNYLELPVLAKVSFGTDTKFFFVVGPSLGFGLGGKAKIKYTWSQTYDGETMTETVKTNGKVKFGDGTDDEETEDIYFENRLDLGAQLGMGVLIKNKIAIEFRYGLGFSSLMEDIAIKNRALQFSVAMPIILAR